MPVKEHSHHKNPRSSGVSTSDVYRKRGTDQQLDSEAAELRRCRELKLRTQHVTTAELLHYDPSTNILSTKKFPGMEMFHFLWNSTYWLGRLRGAKPINAPLLSDRVKELAIWLKHYHASSTEPAMNSLFQPSWLVESFQRKLEGIGKHGLLKPHRLRQIELRFMPALETISTIGGSPTDSFICRIHGDFTVYNMLINDNYDIHIIDFGDTKVSSNLLDVVRFYSGIWAIAHTNSFRKRLLLPLATAFLNAYGLSGNEKESPLFEGLLAFNFLVHLYGCHHMRHLLSPISWLEMRKITAVGLRWIDNKIS